LTAREYALATPEAFGGQAQYEAFCRVAGLPPRPGGWGLLHALDEAGNRVTGVTEDVEYLRALINAAPETIAGMEIPADRFPRVRPGWPDEWPAEERGKRRKAQSERRRPRRKGGGAAF
jgi:hypothetical protein